MGWKDECVAAISEENLFVDSWHRTRFKELLDVYGDYEFFSSGLCKNMYLGAWDDEHFAQILEILSHLELQKESNTIEMRINGDMIIMEEGSEDDYYIMMLSNAFLDDAPFYLTEKTLNSLSPRAQKVIRQGLRAAEIIDQLDL